MSTIRITVEYRCARCPVTKVDHVEVPVGGQGPNMGVPPGWTMLMGDLYCPNHEVVVRDAKGRG